MLKSYLQYHFLKAKYSSLSLVRESQSHDFAPGGPQVKVKLVHLTKDVHGKCKSYQKISLLGLLYSVCLQVCQPSDHINYMLWSLISLCCCIWYKYALFLSPIFHQVPNLTQGQFTLQWWLWMSHYSSPEYHLLQRLNKLCHQLYDVLYFTVAAEETT